MVSIREGGDKAAQGLRVNCVTLLSVCSNWEDSEEMVSLCPNAVRLKTQLWPSDWPS